MHQQGSVFKRWIKFVELSTKLLSLTPFFIGLAYSLYRNGRINTGASILLLVAVFFWSLTVTMINNYIDKRKEGGVPHFSKGVSLALIAVTGGASMLIGLWLSWLYGLPLLLAGVASFAVGILYSWGPISISHTPYGEIASGLTEGFLVIFLVVYINSFVGGPSYVTMRFDGHSFLVALDWVNMLYLVLLALPNICCTSNIMLANNICDVERDVKSNRYTLPYFIGQKASLRLYLLLYVAAFGAIVVAVLAGVLSPITLVTLVVAPVIYRNVKKFMANPVKGETFVLSVKNYALLLYAYFITILAGWAIGI